MANYKQGVSEIVQIISTADDIIVHIALTNQESLM